MIKQVHEQADSWGQGARKIYEGVSFFREAPHIVMDAKGLAKAAATSVL
jgi:hypothetical protein